MPYRARGEARCQRRSPPSGEQPGELPGGNLARKGVGGGGEPLEPLSGGLVGVAFRQSGVEEERAALHGWDELFSDPPADLAPAARDRLSQLAELEAAWPAHGDRIVHGDLRADNMVRDYHLGVTFVDWAHATTGPACIDAASLAPQLILAGHTPADIAGLLQATTPPPSAVPTPPPRSSPHSPATGTATPASPHPPACAPTSTALRPPASCSPATA
ncbi:phosphotransferase family protein [Streptomyces sp. NPDC020951]|uniref:phosphotransferase family protein n=1 Tax=Streptomyces sp. NPDC020951 TaxID=3365104 RepID=UPI0037BCA3E1